MEKVEINYFFKMFNEETKKNIIKHMKNKISENESDFELFYLFPEQSVGPYEKLKVYQDSLFECCANYISLTNADISIYPKEALDFAELILEKLEANTYSESFVTSLQFIYQRFFDALSLGYPILMSSENDCDNPHLIATFDSSYKLAQFESINMTLLEQATIMTKVLKMELEHKKGPISDVRYCYRKDI